MSISAGDKKRVNWDIAKGCLAQIHLVAPEFLRQAVLIGGIACWFYRNLLTKANDPDFRVPSLTETEERVWLSKDIDFTNFFAQDARDLLPGHLVKDEHGRTQIRIESVPIGFAQVGVTFDPEEVWLEAWIGNFALTGTEVHVRVIDPISLYREKLALSQKRGSQSDALHLALLGEFLRFETVRQIEMLGRVQTFEDQTLPIKFLRAIRDGASEICKDYRVERRIRGAGSGMPIISPSERNLVSEMIKLACD
jgi:hypothetical protein